MTAKEIAEKYVYCMHDALTDKQEIKDMVADIKTYAKQENEDLNRLLYNPDMWKSLKIKALQSEVERLKELLENIQLHIDVSTKEGKICYLDIEKIKQDK